MDEAALLTTMRRHARLRWLGVGFFLVSVPLLAFSIYLFAGGLVPGRRVLVSVFCLGMSLGSFGTNNDTALWAMAELQRRGKLVEPFVAELRHEAAVRADRLREAHASQKAGFVLPLLATSAIVGVFLLNLRDGGFLQGWLA